MPGAHTRGMNLGPPNPVGNWGNQQQGPSGGNNSGVYGMPDYISASINPALLNTSAIQPPGTPHHHARSSSQAPSKPPTSGGRYGQQRSSSRAPSRAGPPGGNWETGPPLDPVIRNINQQLYSEEGLGELRYNASGSLPPITSFDNPQTQYMQGRTSSAVGPTSRNPSRGPVPRSYLGPMPQHQDPTHSHDQGSVSRGPSASHLSTQGGPGGPQGLGPYQGPGASSNFMGSHGQYTAPGPSDASRLRTTSQGPSLRYSSAAPYQGPGQASEMMGSAHMVGSRTDSSTGPISSGPPSRGQSRPGTSAGTGTPTHGHRGPSRPLGSSGHSATYSSMDAPQQLFPSRLASDSALPATTGMLS